VNVENGHEAHKVPDGFDHIKDRGPTKEISKEMEQVSNITIFKNPIGKLSSVVSKEKKPILEDREIYKTEGEEDTSHLTDVKKLSDNASLTSEVRKEYKTDSGITTSAKLLTKEDKTQRRASDESKSPTCNQSTCDPTCINMFLLIFTIYHYYTADHG